MRGEAQQLFVLRPIQSECALVEVRTIYEENVVR
jgi:hypothetical protein